MAPHGCLKVADEAIGSRGDLNTQSDGTTLMVNLGLIFLAMSFVTIAFEAMGVAFACFFIACLLIGHA